MTAEQAVLGSMLIDSTAAQTALDELAAEQFGGHAEAEIFRAAMRCRAQHNAVDLITVQAALSDAGTLDAVGGIAYLVELGQLVPTSANIASYIQRVQHDSAKRRLIHGMQSLLSRSAETTPQELSASLELLARENEDKGQQDDSMRAIVLEEYNAIESRSQGANKPVATGISGIDTITGGMTKGEMWVIGARPSVGKSTLAMQIAETAVFAGKTAVFFSAEMSRQMIAQRLFAQMGVETWKTRSGKLSEEDWDKATAGLSVAQQLERLYIDTKSVNIPNIRAKCRKIQAGGGLDLVVVDYLQILQSTQRKESRNLEVSAISAELKLMAKEFDLPVVVLSQLSRAGAYNGKPTLVHLRDSGSIEQDADVAILLYRLEQDDLKEEHGGAADWLLNSASPTVRMDVAKNRNGPLGYTDMLLDGKQMRFVPAVQQLPSEQTELPMEQKARYPY